MAQPVHVDTSVIAVTGGHLGKKDLVVRTDEQDERSFVTVDRTNPRFRLFVGGNYTMMDHLIKMRNDAVDKRLDAAQMEDDPLGEAGAASGDRHFKRKVAYEDIDTDQLVEIKPRSEGNKEHVVLVRPHWYKRAKLSLEATEENFELLLKKPMSVSNEFRPTINAEGVTWNKSRSCVWLAYFDGKESHTKSLKVTFGEGWSNQEKQNEVDSVVQELLVWYDSNNKDSVDDEGDNEADAAEGHADALQVSQDDKDD